MKKVELLAPAGNMMCLKAAIEAGCDAVYLAGNLYGARSFAGNFNNDELRKAVELAHLYGVKVYVTANTIIYEREVENFLEYIRFLHKINVDAVIMQDLGMMDLVRKKFPNLEIHASTQMHIHNYEGALFAQKLGIKRVVLARETPIKVIEKIKKELDIEVEIFVHGALCISYSGQCLMSTLIGNRSGNRGTCSQCCRKPYDLYDISGKKISAEKYLLSTKDLNTLEYLDEIINSGVDSLKIEGRMKRPEYVYLVTKIYRKVIDNYYKIGKLIIDKEDELELKKIFNREFTKGFMLKEKNEEYTYEVRPNHKGIKIGKVVSKINNDLKIKLTDTLNLHDGLRIIDEKEDKGLVVNKMYVNGKEVLKAFSGDVITIKFDKYVKPNSDVLLTTDYNQLKKINEEIASLKRKVLIDMVFVAKMGKKAYIEVNDKQNKVSISSDFIVEQASNKPITKEMVVNQLTKTGNTVYKIDDIKIDVDDNIFINIKDINELRRTILEKLDNKRLYKNDFIENDYYIDVPDFNAENKTSILLNTKEEYEENKNNYDIIYTEDKELLVYDNVLLKLPRVINDYKEIDSRILIGEVGSILKYKQFDTDFSFNVVNSYTLAFLHSVGSKKVTLSYELNETQIDKIIKEYKKRYNKHPNVEVIVDSYPEAMICKFDLNKKYNQKVSYLKDEFNNKYKIISDNEFMRIYNYKKVIFESSNELYNIGINYLRKNL